MSTTMAIAPVESTGASDDATLVARAKAGDRHAFGTLADRHATQLRRVVFRITHNCDAAYDVVQDALLLARSHRAHRACERVPSALRVVVSARLARGRTPAGPPAGAPSVARRTR